MLDRITNGSATMLFSLAPCIAFVLKEILRIGYLLLIGLKTPTPIPVNAGTRGPEWSSIIITQIQV